LGGSFFGMLVLEFGWNLAFFYKILFILSSTSIKFKISSALEFIVVLV
jgi:hypothetical protein